MSEPNEFYYNLSTGQVEQGRVSGASDRMGPYPTAEAAAQAFSTARERNAEWEEENEEWEEQGWSGGDDDAGAVR